ncbi:MAG: hypothetical protein K6E59_04015 [Bacilli bacterium]|nr:hypothetical protein [Bacilli bacterium]
MGNEVYAVIDLKSFYASCECAARGLDIFSTPLVVADKSRSVNSIVMSVTPFLKQRYLVPNVCRIGDLPNVPRMIYAKPRMSYYLEMSAKIVSLFLDYVAEEDLHVYSIDESFLRITPYLKLHNCDAMGFVAKIQKEIMDRYGLVATAGLGPNMFLAKACLDNEGKKKPPYRAYWGEEDVKEKLWRIQPLTKVWGIAKGISTRLSKRGIRSLEALAKSSPEMLQEEFGVIGLDLHDMANGIDRTDIRQKYVPKERSLTQGQVLMKDYSAEEALLVIKEIVDELCVRLRQGNEVTGCVSLFIGYSSTSLGGGFNRQCSLNLPTDDNDLLFEAVRDLFYRHKDDKLIRNISIAFGKLRPYNGYRQQSLLEDEGELMEKRALRQAMDRITLSYGRNAVLRASALLSNSTVIARHGMIGGHAA